MNCIDPEHLLELQIHNCKISQQYTECTVQCGLSQAVEDNQASPLYSTLEHSYGTLIQLFWTDDPRLTWFVHQPLSPIKPNINQLVWEFQTTSQMMPVFQGLQIIFKKCQLNINISKFIEQECQLRN